MGFDLVAKARATKGVRGAAVTDLQGNLHHMEGIPDETVRFVSLVTALTANLAKSPELGSLKRIVFAGEQDTFAVALDDHKVLAVQGDNRVSKTQLSDDISRLVLEA